MSGEPGRRLRLAYTETPDATDASPKALPPCLASGGHETSAWMFPGSCHMISDVSLFLYHQITAYFIKFILSQRCYTSVLKLIDQF